MRRFGGMVATTSIAVALALAVPAAAAPGDGERTAQRLGVQLVPKHRAGKSASAFSNPKVGANPLVSLLPDPAKADYAYWKSAMKQQVGQAGREASKALAPRAAAGGRGGAGGLPRQQRHARQRAADPAFGSASDRRPAARILGTLAAAAEPDDFVAASEDNGSIPLADETGLSGSGSVDPDGRDDRRRAARLGRGQEGRLRLLRRTRGVGGPAAPSSTSIRRPAISTRSCSSTTRPGTSSQTTTTRTSSGASTTACSRSCSRPTATTTCRSRASRASRMTPRTPAAATGSAPRAPTRLRSGSTAIDVDTYAVNLRAGDVLGGSVSGSGACLTVNDPAGREVHGSTQDASCIYPAARRCRAAATRWWTTSPRATGATTSP